MKYRYREPQEMKDSGVEWLGMIPKEWEVSKIKYMASIYGRIGFRGYTKEDIVDEGMGAIALSPSNIIRNNINYENSTYISLDKYYESPEIIINEGDVVFVKTGSTIGKVCIVNNKNEKVTLNPQLIVLKNIKNANFLFYSMVSSSFQNNLLSKIPHSTIPNISQEKIENLEICFTNLNEQQIVATFLDQKTAEFDNIIAKKESLINKLEEAKKSLISEVVTGKKEVIVDNGKLTVKNRKAEVMKDSGVEWLGMIPKAWGRTKLKNLVSTKITDGPHETPEFIDEGIPFLSAEAINIDKLNFEGKRGFISIEKHLEYCKKSKVIKNDILFCKSGSTTGKSALVETDENFGIWSPLAIIRANKKINYKSLFYFIQSRVFRTQVEVFWSFGTQPNIGMGTLENLFVAYSKSLQEQELINNFLDEKTAKINNIIEKTKLQIEKLKEAKQSLISEAVTGKIEVM